MRNMAYVDMRDMAYVDMEGVWPILTWGHGCNRGHDLWIDLQTDDGNQLKTAAVDASK